ncbi:MAG TPA: hypothetical protein PK453_02875 [Leptospiraceae bacterium]|nr:hypothetical protein [Leptospiraceae bacterium]HNF12586.1 hypothetical protein [Leptospiraceae bacterium]HNF23763.1 hypothetical protein [Leptospiraceae bacterium]HNI24713.1 hypothetical protein [Leptospiraceae bacterium]HNI98147.1 hypothetical protein [Leptospiraceae bacterium]
MQIKKHNIYKMDDYLLAFGISGFFLMLFGLTLILSGDTAALIIGLFLVTAPISMVTAGAVYRKKEKEINHLINILETNLEIDVPSLLQITGKSAAVIKKYLEIIQNKGIGFYLWDDRAYKVYDRRLLNNFLFIEKCPDCGAKIGRRYPLIMDRIPCCDHCGNPFDLKYWNELKLNTVKNIAWQNLETYRLQMNSKKELNTVLLIVLFTFFWPAGICYLISNSD